MKLHLTIYGPRGFYPSPKDIEAHTLKAALEQILPALDKLPDECDGQKLVDWKHIAITILRNPTSTE